MLLSLYQLLDSHSVISWKVCLLLSSFQDIDLPSLKTMLVSELSRAKKKKEEVHDKMLLELICRCESEYGVYSMIYLVL